MAAVETVSLTTPILNADKIEESDFHEAETNGKGTPTKEIKSNGGLGSKGENTLGTEQIKSSNSVSNSLLKTAAFEGVKNETGDVSSLTTQHKTSSSNIKDLSELKNNATLDRLSSGQGWVSFEEDGSKKKGTVVGVALVTQSQSIEGTPLVNGAVDKIPTAKTLDGTTNAQLSAGTGKVSTNTNLTESGTFDTKREDSLIIGAIKSDLANANMAQSEPEAASGWVTFDELSRAGREKPKLASTSSNLSAKGIQSQSSTASSPTTPQPSWVTFDESKATNGVSNTAHSGVLEGLSVNVTIANQIVEAPSTPSPNPFLNAPMIKNTANPFQGASPLSVVTSTNPFHSGGVNMALTGGTYPGSVAPTGAVGGLNITSMTPAWSTTPVYHDVSLLERSLNKPTELTVQQTVPVKPITPPAVTTTLDQINASAATTVVDEERPVVTIEDKEEELEDFSLSPGNTSWNMLLRYPDKKKRIGSREWKAVVIKLEGNTLHVYEEYELSAPFREIPLQASFNFQELRLQEERHSKVHTTKLEYLKYQEVRSVRHKGTIEHLSEGTPIIKIGSTSNAVMREFIEAVSNSIRTLPAYRDRGITYRKDEVFVDVDDTCHALLDGEGNVKKQGGRVQVKLRAFVTGDPECQLVLNDIVVKEKEESRLRGELKPQRVHHWIKLHNLQFHKCVDVNAFNESHAITFHPLDACTFELVRFRADMKKPLPLSVKASLTLHTEQRIELKAEIQLCQETKMAKYARNNVIFRLPIPETWVPLFRTGKSFGREKSIKSSKGKRAAGIKSRLKHSRCSIAASFGTAQYEPEYSAVVWRIDKLPLIQSKIPVDAPQTLTCLLELPSGMEFPDNYQPHAEVEYDVSYVLLSDTTVIAVKVSNKNIPEKWVCYRAFYHYHIDMSVFKGSSVPIRDVGCTQQ